MPISIGGMVGAPLGGRVRGAAFRLDGFPLVLRFLRPSRFFGWLILFSADRYGITRANRQIAVFSPGMRMAPLERPLNRRRKLRKCGAAVSDVLRC